MNTSENKRHFSLTPEHLIFQSLMLNRLKRKAKRGLNKEQFEVYEEVRQKGNDLLKTLTKEDKHVCLDYTEKELSFLRFFFKTTSQQMIDNGMKVQLLKLLEVYEGGES